MKNEELRIKNEGGNFLERKVSFFKVQEIIKFSEAESKMISSFQPLNMLNLLIIN